jgi:hypothetical protein
MGKVIDGEGAALLTRVRKTCLSIDGVIETISHGEPTWWTKPKGRTFAMFDHHHHGAAHIGVVVAATLDVQRALVAEQPDRYLVPPYVGAKGWVTVVLNTRPDWNAVDQLLRQAHAFIAAPRPKALVRR